MSILTKSPILSGYRTSLIYSTAHKKTQKLMQDNDVVFVTPDNLNKLRGVLKLEKHMIFFEKEILMENSGNMVNMIGNVFGSVRGINYSYNLCKIASKNKSIIVVSKKQDEQFYKTYIRQIFIDEMQQLSTFKLLLKSWTKSL